MAEPDTTESRIRFGCGGVLGAILGVVLSLQIEWTTWPPYVVVIASSAVVLGLLAMWFGDDFWFGIAKIGEWWWR